MTVTVLDDLLVDDAHRLVFAFLQEPGWRHGWKSDPKAEGFPFFHKHFAGTIHPDHYDRGGEEKPYDCVAELARTAPLLHEFWTYLAGAVFPGHRLIRCYANGHPYGADGTVHTDSLSDRGFTAIYYPHIEWSPHWGGETVFFDEARTDVVKAVYPKPNRLAVFNGTVPHAARGIARTCPVMRMTLMFKTEVADA